MTLKKLGIAALILCQAVVCCVHPGPPPVSAQPKTSLNDVDFYYAGSSGRRYGQIYSNATTSVFRLFSSYATTGSVVLQASATAPTFSLYAGSDRRFQIIGYSGQMILGGSGVTAYPRIDFTNSSGTGSLYWNGSYFSTTVSLHISDDLRVFGDAVIDDQLKADTVWGAGNSHGWGDGTQTSDIYHDFYVSGSNDGQYYWDYSDDRFVFSDDIYMNSMERIYLGGTSAYIYGNVGTVTINGPVLTTSTIRPGTTFQSSSGYSGATGTVTVKGSDGNNCNLYFDDGLLYNTTCP